MALPANATKSTNTTETVRGEHRFAISGYTGKLRAGRRVLTSDTFAVGGLDWAIRYNPGAEVGGDGDEEYATVFVRLVTPGATALALYDLRLVDPAGTGGVPPRSVRRSKGPVAFDASRKKKRQRGAVKFMACRELLESYSYVRDDDRLTVECVLDVAQTSLSETTTAAAGGGAGPPPPPPPPPPDLSRHLGALLLRAALLGADVTFAVQGEASFRAHRAVLEARSPVFKAELSAAGSSSAPAKKDDDGGGGAGEAVVVAVDGVAPPVFKALLHFVYTDALPDELLLGDGGDLGTEEHRRREELVRGLIAAAERYGMDRLRQICELVLGKPPLLDAKTLAAALDPSGQHLHRRHCQALGDGCVEFMPSSA